MNYHLLTILVLCILYFTKISTDRSHCSSLKSISHFRLVAQLLKNFQSAPNISKNLIPFSVKLFLSSYVGLPA
jgi:hypothetical protein